MSSSRNTVSFTIDDDDDLEMQELFGFRPASRQTTNNNTNATSRIDSSHSKERDNYDFSIKRMEENIQKCKNETGNFVTDHHREMDEGVKFVKLEEYITDKDIEDMESKLFQQYTENENETDDDLLVMMSGSSSSSSSSIKNVDGNDDDDDCEEERNDSYSFSDSEVEEDISK